MVFTTADMPTRFLKDAFLVGHIPHRVLRCDMRLSYSLYVPPSHYDGTGGSTIPLQVYIHGTGRNLSPMHSDLEAFADDVGCAVLAPLFPAGLEGLQDLDSYKLTGAATLRSDQALLAMIEEIEQVWVGIYTKQFFLMGFSGGGQFAHRFLYLHPERLSAASVGAPGSVTLLDQQKDWPHGVKGIEGCFGRLPSLTAMRLVPIHLIVGSADNDAYGGAGFTRWLRDVRALDDSQTKSRISSVHSQGRVQSLRELMESLKQASIEVTFELVEGIAHHSDSVRTAQLGFMKEQMSLKKR
ncbi:hypothetical protein LTR86_001741 [Recurvomyces mirabilis]|nr:hypothetical protein LTR86_001741 [Recurvomyces mirabilis]